MACCVGCVHNFVNKAPFLAMPDLSYYENPLIGRYASPEMSTLWGPQRKFSTWRRLWVALAEAEAQLGLPITKNQIDELRQSLVDLRDQTGYTPFAVSYPYGGPRAVSPDVVAAAQAAGLRLGFTMERAFNRSLDAPLLLARVDTNDAPGGKSPQIEITNGNAHLVGNVCPHRSLWVEQRG